MPECIVLGDDVAHDILINLKRDDIIAFRDEISKTLVDFSATDERTYQPEPAVVTRPDGRKALFRPFTSNNGPGIKIIVDPTTPSAAGKTEARPESTNTTSKKPTLHGILAVCDEDGLPKGFINAEEITAYRTSMSVMIPYAWRSNTANVVVFGAGKTALWHIRQALGLRGEEIMRITVVNRSVERARALIDQVQQENEKFWRSPVVFHNLNHDHSKYEEDLQEAVSQADVIFCTTPSSHSLFPAHYLTRGGAARRSLFVSGIGSWQPEMAELDPALFTEAASAPGGAVVVDDRDGALKSSGEIIQSGLTAEQIMELGELLHMRDTSLEGFSKEQERCLRGGLVVYKSVGVSLTDLAAANAVLALARRQGKGVLVPHF
ncbi:hypothetical protein H2201_009159 [Coniosporium apollinis]|uniref:Quinate/shikimate 5-dehydrogenase/glutamyl-tRNA reductase domain-containing protein n=1 Tax=Coniosporium apollinis TaxID=61459 RepID=A0ABQ9NIJ1_9PEZI|nr:hypothetical protein H2201_009159 [Coniosporium apollinis]